MGSYISIGFVYTKTNDEKINIEFDNLLKYLILRGGKINNMKVSKDIDGEEWIEEREVKEQQLGILTKYFYGQLNLTSSFIKEKSLNFTIHIKKKSSYFGFLLDVCETDLFSTGGIKEIENIEDIILNFIIDIYNASAYDYAFCDNEASLEYSPEEFASIKNSIYSIAVTSSNIQQIGKLNVIKSDWSIDGLTKRN